MTHGAHDLVAHRLGGEPVPQLLTGGVACYRIYETADGRLPHGRRARAEVLVRRLCELVGLPGARRTPVGAAPARAGARLASKPLAEWLELFDGEDVGVGPVATLEEAAREFADEPRPGRAPALGEHTDAWRKELGAD